MGMVLIVVLTLLLLGAWPVWDYSRNWGYTPCKVIGGLILLVIVLACFGVLHIGPPSSAPPPERKGAPGFEPSRRSGKKKLSQTCPTPPSSIRSAPVI